jgi:hypothetical protein
MTRTGEIDTVGPNEIYFKPGTRYAYSGEGLKVAGRRRNNRQNG